MATQRLIPMREPTRNLACGFWRSADRFADRPALDFGQCVVSYAQLRELACSLAATLDKHQPPEGPRLVGILRQGGALKAAISVDGEVVVVRAGERAGAYTVLAIDEDDGVRLSDASGAALTLAPPQQ